jgi:hypothetical protein
LVFLFFVLILGAKALEGVQFHQHGDAYITYLVGPRALGATGSWEPFIRLPQLFLGTTVESLFAWGTVLMGLKDGSGLDLSQWFSQWVSGVLALGGIFLGLYAILTRIHQRLALQNHLILWITLLGAQVPALRWTQNLAKNDTGISFLGVGGFYFMTFLAPHSAIGSFFGGTILGALFVGKMATAPFVAVMGIYLFFQNRKVFLFAIFGGILGAAPILIRNGLLTQNPFFPWLPSLFPSPLMNEFLRLGGSAATAKTINVQDFFGYMLELVRENYVITLLPAGLWFLFKRDRHVAFLILLPMISFLFFTLALRPSTEIRYQGPSLVLVSAFGGLAAAIFVSMTGRISRVLNWVFVIFVLGTTNLTLFTYLQVKRSDKFGTFNEIMPRTRYIGGAAKTWIRNNIPSSSTIISFGDIHIYYLIDYQLIEVSQSKEHGGRIYGMKVSEAADYLKNSGYDFLYLAREDYFKGDLFNDVPYTVGEIMDSTSHWEIGCKKFDHPAAQVWDLRCLAKVGGP